MICNSLFIMTLETTEDKGELEFLNTFMFYHNHRRYHVGKREGKTPMELLTGKTQQLDYSFTPEAEKKYSQHFSGGSKISF